jgi:hypothetical protein
MSSLATTEPPRYNPLMARILLQLRHAGRDRVSLSEFLCEALPPISSARSARPRLEVESPSARRRGGGTVNGSRSEDLAAILHRGDGITALIDPERFAYEKENDEHRLRADARSILFETTRSSSSINPHDSRPRPRPRKPGPSTGGGSALSRRGLRRIHHRLDRDTSGAILFTRIDARERGRPRPL